MNYAIILAGGKGTRMGKTDVPKQFIELGDKPMVEYSFVSAQTSQDIDAVCVVCPLDWQEQVRQWAAAYSKVRFFAEGGVTRQESVHNGLKALAEVAQPSDTVMIMTAVCPLLSMKTIDKHYLKMKEYDACITVVKATDAITFSNDGRMASRTLQKRYMFMQQGPQTYRYKFLKQAHEMHERDVDATMVHEDSELLLHMGVEVAMVKGDRYCIKVTYAEDLAIARALLPLFTRKEAKRQQMKKLAEEQKK